ncbi:MAG: sigma 54-interacting transcriptional regulator [Planctomycetes bacterium]|nr:sigma 54-interacting transcriptional regulator [Planctomycetota bacterium]
MTDDPFLLIVTTGAERSTHRFSQDQVSIGRSRDCDLSLQDRLVSRQHCRLERRDGGFVLVDTGAQNPARLRGLRVGEEPITYGEVFVVGDCEIQLVSGGGERPSLDETALVDAAQNAKDLEAFIRVAKVLNEESDLSKLLTAIVDAAIELSGAERGFLLLGDGEDSTVEVARNFAQEEVHTPEFKISRTIAQRVHASGVPELTTNAQEDDRFSGLASVTDLRLRSVLCIPLRIRGEVDGVLYVDNRLQNQVFKEREKALLISLADHAGVAVHNARTMRELRSKQGELQAAVDRVAQLNAALRGQVEDQLAEIADMRDRLDTAMSPGEFRYDYSQIVGRSRRMREVFRLLDKFIGAEDPVLILGESGTGKELIARAIHRLGDRSDGPFVSENCAALPESLLESELFGYEKGAFTGADKARDGLFVAASGGVLFLDEVGEMHVDLQKKLLRVLQEGEVRPLGSQRTIKVDVRLVTATNRNLEQMAQDGEFRSDLYYRLAVLPVMLPPLRERRDDIPFLVDRFLEEAAAEHEGVKPRISSDALDAIMQYRWPGNVRELQNEIRRASILADGVILREHLSETVRQPRAIDATDDVVPAERGTTLPDLVRDLEIREIRRALHQAGGNKSRTAEMLGVSRFALQRKLEKFEIESDGTTDDDVDADTSEDQTA